MKCSKALSCSHKSYQWRWGTSTARYKILYMGNVMSTHWLYYCKQMHYNHRRSEANAHFLLHLVDAACDWVIYEQPVITLFDAPKFHGFHGICYTPLPITSHIFTCRHAPPHFVTTILINVCTLKSPNIPSVRKGSIHLLSTAPEGLVPWKVLEWKEYSPRVSLSAARG